MYFNQQMYVCKIMLNNFNIKKMTNQTVILIFAEYRT